MPELPEVEAVRRVIEPQIQGLAIEQIIVKRPEVVAHPAVNEFCCRLRGQICDRVVRRGKFLVIMLKSGDRIIIHLRMTGCLLLTPTDYPEEKHTHIILRLNSNKELRFSDTRRFGRFWLLQKGEADTYSGIEKLGKEPLAPDFTAEYLSARLGNRKKSIKEWKLLAQVIPDCLSFFIQKNDMSPKEYLETKGRDYRNTPFLQVYGHGGEPCPICRSTLCRMVIGGRSSTFCPHCQK